MSATTAQVLASTPIAWVATLPGGKSSTATGGKTMGAAVIPLVTGLATAGASVYGAKKQASAQTAATNAQTAASTRAAELQLIAEREAAEREAAAQKESLDFLKQQYETTQRNVAPYLSMGQGALTSLSSFMGIPVSGGYTPTTWPSGSSQTSSSGGTVPSTAPRSLTSLSSFSPSASGIRATDEQLPVSTSPLSTGEVVSGKGLVNDPLVWMSAPDGSVKRVPTSKVAFYQSRGATRLT